MKASTMIPESEKCNGKGFFGWLGADGQPGWKAFWIAVCVVFGVTTYCRSDLPIYTLV